MIPPVRPISLGDIEAARDNVAGTVLRTPLVRIDLGPDAPEILQVLAIAVKAGLRKSQLDEVVAIHPTMAEELVLLK